MSQLVPTVQGFNIQKFCSDSSFIHYLHLVKVSEEHDALNYARSWGGYTRCRGRNAMLVVLPSQKSYAFRTNISIFFTVFFKDVVVSLYFKHYNCTFLYFFISYPDNDLSNKEYGSYPNVTCGWGEGGG